MSDEYQSHDRPVYSLVTSPNNSIFHATLDTDSAVQTVTLGQTAQYLTTNLIARVSSPPVQEVPAVTQVEHQNTRGTMACSPLIGQESPAISEFLPVENTGTPETPSIERDREGRLAGSAVQIDAYCGAGRLLASEGVPGVRELSSGEKASSHDGLAAEGAGTPGTFDAVTGVPGSGHISFGPFHSDHRGLFFVTNSKEDEPAAVQISGPVRILALSRQIDGTGWGLVIEVPNYDGEWRQIVIPRELLAGNGDAARALLMSMGFHVATQKRSRDALMSFLEQVFGYVVPRRTSVSSVGWHGSEYVTPGQVYTHRQTTDLVLSSGSSAARMLEIAGSLESWRDNVGKFAVGNSRLMLVLGAAFAAPLLRPLGVQGGGVHLRGGSPTGKTTLLRAATSVYSQQNYQMTWRMTDNGLEGIAAARNDALLVLDEMGQVAGGKVGEAIYLLGNGEGKTRANKEGAARLPAKFRIMLLSTGEISLADKINEDRFSRSRVMAGQEVRLLDLPADTGHHGAFEQLHGFADGASLASHLNNTVQSNYGTAFDAFMCRLVEFGAGDWQRLKDLLVQRTSEMLAGRNQGQLQRAAERLSIISLGAELASDFGIGPWNREDASDALRFCFEAWVNERGGTRSVEDMQSVVRIRDFITKHLARFENVFEHDDPGLSSGQPAVRDRAGFAFHQPVGGLVYGFTSNGFKEALDGLNGTLAAQNLAQRGFLQGPDSSGKWSISRTVRSQKYRLYMITESILEAE